MAQILSADFVSGQQGSNEFLFAAQGVMQCLMSDQNPEILERLLTEDAEITLEVNGTIFGRTKKEFLSNLRGTVSDNIESIKMLNLSFEVSGTQTVYIEDRSIQKRKGTGLEESGEGLYYIEDTGCYTFTKVKGKSKISHLSHSYTKTKI
ncbi:MAG: hypothetical protein GY915_00555 [bacterium]|nr:hypothetical protein [bacterium]